MDFISNASSVGTSEVNLDSVHPDIKRIIELHVSKLADERDIKVAKLNEQLAQVKSDYTDQITKSASIMNATYVDLVKQLDAFRLDRKDQSPFFGKVVGDYVKCTFINDKLQHWIDKNPEAYIAIEHFMNILKAKGYATTCYQRSQRCTERSGDQLTVIVMCKL